MSEQQQPRIETLDLDYGFLPGYHAVYHADGCPILCEGWVESQLRRLPQRVRLSGSYQKFGSADPYEVVHSPHLGELLFRLHWPRSPEPDPWIQVYLGLEQWVCAKFDPKDESVLWFQVEAL